MASAVDLRADYSATELRRLAATTKNANQSRRLLSLAAVVDGMNRTEAARIGGVDRQTLRDEALADHPLQVDQRYESAYLFGAICPARGTGAALALPYADTQAMQLH